MIKYLRKAFLNHWNLLALGGGLGFAFLSGRPDVLAPLVLAAEALYVGLLSANPKFQKYVDAQAARSQRQKQSLSNRNALRHILNSLPAASLHRFEELRLRCRELQGIAADLKQPGAYDPAVDLSSFQMEGLDRLLWVFLRLLFTHQALAKFLDRTRVDLIHNDIERLETRLAALAGVEPTPHNEKMKRAVTDNLETCRARLANYEKAQANYEFVELEVDRLENKIKSLAEVAVNRQEPDYISSQVDQVASSMLETEQTMNELQFATGLSRLDEDVPELLTGRLSD